MLKHVTSGSRVGGILLSAALALLTRPALADPSPAFLNGELLVSAEFNGSVLTYDTCAEARDLTSLFRPTVQKAWQPTADGFILRLSFHDEMTGAAHTIAFKLEHASNVQVMGGLCSGRSPSNEVALTRVVQDGEDLGAAGLKYWADKASAHAVDTARATAPPPPPVRQEAAPCDDPAVTDRLIALMKSRTPPGFPKPTIILNNGASAVSQAEGVRTCRARMNFDDSPADIRTVTYTVALGEGGVPQIETQSVSR